MELRGSTLLDDRGDTCGTVAVGSLSRRRATLAADGVEWTLVRTGGSSVRVTGTASDGRTLAIEPGPAERLLLDGSELVWSAPDDSGARAWQLDGKDAIVLKPQGPFVTVLEPIRFEPALARLLALLGAYVMVYETRKRARQRLWTTDWRSGTALP